MMGRLNVLIQSLLILYCMLPFQQCDQIRHSAEFSGKPSTGSRKLQLEAGDYDRLMKAYNELDRKGVNDFTAADLNMFEATQDIKYLHQFVERADRVLLDRESLNHSSPVADGQVMYPLARFAYIISRVPDSVARQAFAPGRAYRDIAGEYYNKAFETWAFHFQSFSTDTVKGLAVGWYSGADTPWALHWMAEVGRASVFLAKAANAPKDSSLHQASVQLCNYFSAQMEQQSDHSLLWKMWPGVDDRWETFANAVTDLQFIALCHEHFGIFYDQEMKALARTIGTRLIKRPLELGADVSGEKNLPAGQGLEYAGAFYPYAELWASLDRVLYDILINYGQFHQKAAGAKALESLSALLLYHSTAHIAATNSTVELPPQKVLDAPVLSDPSATKHCPWGKECAADGDCLSSDVGHFVNHSERVVDLGCYARDLRGQLTNPACLRDPPSAGWIGDFWKYELSASAASGAACDAPRSNNVREWSTEKRVLVHCARKYSCR